MDSFQDLKEKYRFHSQKQLERAKKANQKSKLSEIADQSNVKLLALKKALKTKMDEKKKEKYEKRVLMYKIANEEEEADYEKFFDENESECEPNEEENGDVQPESGESQDAQRSDKENGSQENGSQENGSENSRDQPEDDDSQQPNRDDDESNADETLTNCTPGNLIEQNRDMLTRMINKTQATQMDNEDLLGLCSAKVAARDFIDDECEDDDDDCSMREEADSEGDDEEDEEEDEELNEESQQNEESQPNEESNEAEKAVADEEKADSNSNSGFDLIKHRLKRHRELESDSDDDFSFANQFKFKKTCKIQESDDEGDKQDSRPSSALSFKNKFSTQLDEASNSNDNKLSSINGDDFENLNSQDSQFANNRESTFIESRPNARKARFNVNEFIEDQAELSEEDKDRVSSDEEEDSNDEYEQEEIDENLPSDEEILKANNKMFMKQQMDEDKRELLEYQERFLEYGDLHDDGEVRQRKFKWKNTDNVWVDNVKESSDSDEFDIDDSQIEYTSMHLKQIGDLDKASGHGDEKESQSNEATQSSQASLTKDEKRKKKLMNTSLNKSHLSSYSTFDNSIFNKHMRAFKQNMVSGPANDIQSYIIKDKNLVNAMSVKSSVVAANREKARPIASRAEYAAAANKKRKQNDKNENKKSIFDLF